MTPADIAALRGLCERATPGPWYRGQEVRDGRPVGSWQHVSSGDPEGPGQTVAQWMLDADAAFVTRARSALPALIDEVEKLREALESNEVHERTDSLTLDQIKAALHEGRAEAMAATGDNAWTSLLAARDKLARECQNQAELRGKDAARWAEERDRLRALLAEAVGIARTVDARPELRDDGMTEQDHRGRARMRLRLDELAKEGLT